MPAEIMGGCIDEKQDNDHIDYVYVVYMIYDFIQVKSPPLAPGVVPGA